MERETLDSLRFTFQRVLTPIVVLIGCAGNTISVIVLTRRRMRCSTNIYLTALAIADIVFLLFVLLLSLQHHHALHQTRYSIYWKMYGLSHWICDAAAYTSIWLTVSFTIERYIAVCHPIRGQMLCTESRAKKVIAGCFLLCFLLTVSTAFEYQVEEETRYFTASNNVCPTPSPKETSDVPKENVYIPVTESIVSISKLGMTELLEDTDSESNHKTIKRAIEQVIYSVNATNDNSTIPNDVPNRIMVGDIMCEERPYLVIAISDFGDNDTYKTIFYVMTTILFVFGPLILLATFNCYLIAAVHRSQRLRKAMTNNSNGSGGDSSQQENKITIILIAVCVLFLICQSPTAFVLLYTIIAKPNEGSNEMLALGNVLNFLITLNAACNFILYCLLSDKFRRTTRQLLCGTKQSQGSSSYRDSQMTRFTSFRTSGYGSNSSPSNKRLSINERKNLIYNGDIPPPTITSRGGSNGGKQLKCNNKMTNFSPGTIDEGHELNSRPTSHRKKRPKVIQVIEPDYTSFLRPTMTNCSTTAENLRRSVSLNSRPSPKHSPQCQQNPFKF